MRICGNERQPPTQQQIPVRIFNAGNFNDFNTIFMTTPQLLETTVNLTDLAKQGKPLWEVSLLIRNQGFSDEYATDKIRQFLEAMDLTTGSYDERWNTVIQRLKTAPVWDKLLQAISFAFFNALSDGKLTVSDIPKAIYDVYVGMKKDGRVK